MSRIDHSACADREEIKERLVRIETLLESLPARVDSLEAERDKRTGALALCAPLSARLSAKFFGTEISLG